MAIAQCRNEYGNAAAEYNDMLKRDKPALCNRVMSEVFGTTLYLTPEWDQLLNDEATHRLLGGRDRSLELLNDLENALTVAGSVRLNRATNEGAVIVIQFDGLTLSDHIRGAVRRSLAREAIETDKSLKWIMDFVDSPQDFGVRITAKLRKPHNEMLYEITQAKTITPSKWSKLLRGDADKLVRAIISRFNGHLRVPEKSAG